MHILDTLHALQEKSPERDQHKILIGPWTHGRHTLVGAQGTEGMGNLSYPEALGVSDDYAIRFFDYHLLQKDNGWDDTSPVTYFQLGDDIWKTAEASLSLSLTLTLTLISTLTLTHD